MTEHLAHHRIHMPSAVYPTTTMYLAGVGVLLGVAAGLLSRDSGVLTLTLIAFMIVLVSFTREMKVVHLTVNRQHEDALARISELIDAMHEAGVQLPGDEKEEGS